MKKEQLLDLYHQMVLIRRVEERGAELYQAGKIGGFMHLYIGQEAVSTGLISAREQRDRVITAYRDHGVAINCGIPVNEVMAELLGKATGISKGKGGSMHMASVEKNFWGGHAIVGGHLPIAPRRQWHRVHPRSTEFWSTVSGVPWRAGRTWFQPRETRRNSLLASSLHFRRQTVR